MKKYKKNKINILPKIIVIFYTSTFTATFLMSPTEANFSSQQLTNIVFQASYWYDGSILSFIEKPTQNKKSCAPVEIKVRLQNIGFDMLNSTTYEVYYSNNANGNPKQTGSKIGEGVLNPLAENEIGYLYFNAEEDGAYMFKLYQHPEFQEKHNIKSIEWSEKIIVNCNAAKQTEEDDKSTDGKSTKENDSDQQEEKDMKAEKVDENKKEDNKIDDSTDTKENNEESDVSEGMKEETQEETQEELVNEDEKNEIDKAEEDAEKKHNAEPETENQDETN
ncbi:amyloid fiber anchoring/assembly protein TapA [Sutcliffiella horikoshii]